MPVATTRDGAPSGHTEGAATERSTPAEPCGDPVSKRPMPPRWDWLPVVVILFLIVALALVDAPSVFEPPHLLPVVNGFILATALVAAVLAAWGYLATGAQTLLLLGGGMLTFGLASLAGALFLRAGRMEAALVAHNPGTLIAGVFHLVSAFRLLSPPPPAGPRGLRLARIAFVYALAVASLAALVFLGDAGLMPRFMTPSGTTPLRIAVLTLAVATYLVSALLFRIQERRVGAAFFRWYWLGLILVGTGLAAVTLASRVGSAVGWVGRGSQALGQVYVFVCLLTIARRRRAGDVARAVGLCFRQLEMEHAAIWNAAAEGIVVADEEARIVYANRRMEEILGMLAEDLVGTPLGDLLAPHAPPDERERLRAQLLQEALRGLDVRCRRADSRDAAALVNTSVLRDSQGRVMQVVAMLSDTAERVRAEDALRRSEERFRQAALQAGMVVFAQDRELRYTWTFNPNPAFDDGRHLGRTDLDLHPGEPGTRLTALKRRVIETGFGAREEVRLTIGGQPFAYDLMVEPQLVASGAVTGIVGYAVDITERMRAADALRASEERYHSLFNSMTEGFALHEIVCGDEGHPCDYRFLDINPAFERYTGLKREEVVGRLRSEVLPGDDAYWVDIYGRVALTGAPVQFENYSTALDRYYEVFAFRPAPMQFAVIFMEVTARKRAEERLIHQNATLKGVTGILQGALAGASEEQVGRIALAVAEDLTGSRLGFIGMTNAEGRLDNIAISDPGWESCRVEGGIGHRIVPTGFGIHGVYGRVLLDGQGFYTNDPASHPDSIGLPPGHPPIAAFLGAPLTHSGKSIGMVGMANREGGYRAEDMETLQVLAPVIVEALMRQRAEEGLRLANRALKDADRRKDEFLAMLAHELRNPLAAIVNAVHLMRARGLDDPALAKARDAAERQAGHMAHLLDDLLDVSRVTQGKITLRKKRVEIGHVIESAVDTARPAIEEHAHRLHVSMPQAPIEVDADPVRLAQVLANLLGNAAKYTPPGGEIHLEVEASGPEVQGSGSEVAGPCLEIRVRDNGSGIEPGLLPHVFGLFVQGERGPDRTQGGLGIGLTMVRSLVELHGGSVEARSAGPGRGSNFIVRLPLEGSVPAPQGSAEAAPGPGTPEPARARRILLVDDNADAAEMLGSLLEMEGYEVVIAHSGPEALDRALTNGPDTILMDIGMPGMDGYEAARRLRQDPALPQTVLIALTGYGQEEDRERSRQAGFDHHLAKPVQVEELLRLLASPLNARSHRSAA